MCPQSSKPKSKKTTLQIERQHQFQHSSILFDHRAPQAIQSERSTIPKHPIAENDACDRTQSNAPGQSRSAVHQSKASQPAIQTTLSSVQKGYYLRLSNSGNACYLNVIVQTFLACGDAFTSKVFVK